MGPTRKRDLTAATVIAAALGYVLVTVLYRWFPPITVWTDLKRPVTGPVATQQTAADAVAAVG